MCGRFVLRTPPDRLAELFDAALASSITGVSAASYNIAPTTQVLGIAPRPHGGRLLDTYRWGLIPSWAKDSTIGKRCFNARAESVATKPAFRSAFRSRRIAVLADGYFEWRKGPGNARQPFYFRRVDSVPLAFAGLQETWLDRGTGNNPAPLQTCTIITTSASSDLSLIHDRMPVVLEEGALSAWLDPSNDDSDELEALMCSPAKDLLTWYPVDRRVGDVKNNDLGLIEPVDEIGRLE